MLVVDQVEKRFRTRTGTVSAVAGVSFSLAAGEVLAFLGPNGAGKTTTIKMCAGLIRPDAGRVTVDGHDMVREAAAGLRCLGAVLEGSRNVYWRMTPLENLVYWGMMRGLSAQTARTRGLALLERVGLAAKAHNTVQTLSRGMQQKTALCTALIHAPRLLLLDEPTLGLDWRSAADIKALVEELRREGTAILLTTHQLDVAEELSTRLAVIDGGRLVLEGQTKEVLARFSRPAYRIRLAAPPTAGEAERLRALGAVPAQSPEEFLWFGVSGSGPDDLRRVLDQLLAAGPLAIEGVVRDRADLLGVLERLEGGGLPTPGPRAEVGR